MSGQVPTMSSNVLARHWQTMCIRTRRIRRAVPSLLVIIFVIAITTILFFPDIDASSFASPINDLSPKVSDSLNALPRLSIQDDLVNLKDSLLSSTESEETTSTGTKLAADDPVITSIAKLRRELAANYEIDHWRGSRALNDPALERLSTCLQAGSCGPGEENVVLLATFHFGHANLGMVSGEDIWARSSLEAFAALNYTLLYTYGHMDTLMMYQHIPNHVKIVIWEGEQLRRCMARNDTHFDESVFKGEEMQHTPGTWQDHMKKGCIKKDGFEHGIPIWKSFSFHFWPTNPHPLGEKWTLAPYDYKAVNGMENFHLGYSIQEGCEQIPLAKNKKHRAIVLGKRPEYFAPDKLAWPNMLPAVANNISPAQVDSAEGDDLESFRFVGAYAKDGKSKVIAEQGVETLGKLSMEGWFQAVGESKAMLGIGNPYLSPSPFDGLCQGTPFINVVKHWDQKDPENKKKWRTQHDPLLSLDAPYIYHVRSGDQEGLEKAVQSAVDNPIGRYIPPTMTRESVRERHQLLVETNWEKEGRIRIEDFLEEGKRFDYIA